MSIRFLEEKLTPRIEIILNIFKFKAGKIHSKKCYSDLSACFLVSSNFFPCPPGIYARNCSSPFSVGVSEKRLSDNDNGQSIINTHY